MPEWYLTLNTGAEKHSDGSSPQLVVLLLPTFLPPLPKEIWIFEQACGPVVILSFFLSFPVLCFLYTSFCNLPPLFPTSISVLSPSVSPLQTLVSPSPLLPGRTNRRIRPTWVPWRPPRSTPPPPSPPAEPQVCLPSVTCLDDCQVLSGSFNLLQVI